MSLSAISCTLVGNVIIVFSYFQNYKMRTVTNTMVLNHCFTDILIAMSDIAFYGAPAYIPSLMENDVFCTLSTFFDSLFKVASFLSMFCIALDRYINLVRARRRRMTKEIVKALFAWVWIQSLLMAAPWDKLAMSGEVKIKCAFLLPLLFEAGSAIQALSIVFKIICVLFPILSVYYISYRVFSSGRRRRRVDVEHGSGLRRRFASELNTARSAPAEITARLLLGVYTVCTAPFLAAIIWTIFRKNQVLVPGLAFAVYFMFRLKGSLFPIIYITRNRVVLHSIQKLVCCTSSVSGSAKAFVVDDPQNQYLARHFSAPAPGNRCNRRQGSAREARIFFGARSGSVKFDFTDLKHVQKSQRERSLSRVTAI